MKNLLPCLIAGSITGVMQVTYCLSFAVLIFSGRLEPFSTIGIDIAFLSCFCLTLVMAIKSSMPGIATGLQGSATAVMALLLTSITASIPTEASPQEMLVTVIATMGLCTLFTGGFCWILGHLRLGNLIRFIPDTFIAVFLAGTGCLIFKGGMEVMIGFNLTPDTVVDLFTNPQLLKHWMIGVALGLLMLVLIRKYNHWSILPCCILGSFCLFYGVLNIFNVSLAEAGFQGWLLDFTPKTTSWVVLQTSSLGDINWQIIIQNLSNQTFLLSLILLSTLELMFSISGVEITMGRNINLNQELKAFGIGTMTTVFFGGMIGCHSLSGAIIANNLKAQKRLTSFITACILLLFLALGANFMSLIPRPILGGLLVYLGLSLFFFFKV